MKETVQFLRELTINNDREWFKTNKGRYDAVKATTERLAGQLISGIGAFDRSVSGLSYRDCTYRIYRDVRFSLNKDPYKNHIGIYICRGGKKSNFAGYYLHIEPGADDSACQYFLSAGVYMPMPADLRSIREEIDDNGEQFAEAIRSASGFELETGNRLKKLPAGFTSGSPYDELLRNKDYLLTRRLTLSELLAENLPVFVTAEFRRTYEFIRILNRAIEYARSGQ